MLSPSWRISGSYYLLKEICWCQNFSEGWAKIDKVIIGEVHIATEVGTFFTEDDNPDYY